MTRTTKDVKRPHKTFLQWHRHIHGGPPDSRCGAFSCRKDYAKYVARNLRSA